MYICILPFLKMYIIRSTLSVTPWYAPVPSVENIWPLEDALCLNCSYLRSVSFFKKIFFSLVFPIASCLLNVDVICGGNEMENYLFMFLILSHPWHTMTEFMTILTLFKVILLDWNLCWYKYAIYLSFPGESCMFYLYLLILHLWGESVANNAV